MTQMLRAALFAAFTVACTPAVVVGQNTSADSLVRRIALLERTTTDLERRVLALEALIKVEPSASRKGSTPGNWRDLQNWRQLQLGMSPDEVRALLGEPERVEAGAVTHWFWAGANVYFMGGELSGWSEPKK